MSHIYDANFMDYTAQSSRHSARIIVAHLRKLLPTESILDVGCARGTWLDEWRRAGITDFFGIDGDYIETTQLQIPPEHFRSQNLAQKFTLGRQFDLVQSLEVAEHLPESAATQFIENLAAHSKGPILFSAAPPGQGGEYHVNEKPYEYWRDKFKSVGFEPYDCIRPLLRTESTVSCWYRYNTILYVNRHMAGDLPEFLRTTRVPADSRILDIAPGWFRLRKRLIRMLPFSAQQLLARMKARCLRQ